MVGRIGERVEEEKAGEIEEMREEMFDNNIINNKLPIQSYWFNITCIHILSLTNITQCLQKQYCFKWIIYFLNHTHT